MSSPAPSYRWVVLAVGVAAQASSAAVLQGLPGLAPQLRDDYGLGLGGLGVVLASVTLGLVSTLLLWGALADRLGERWVMTVGLLCASASCQAATHVEALVPLCAVLFLAGAFGASVNAASGRAVLGWFGPDERAFAMGLRQTALPLGAGIAAAVLPPVAVARGLDAAFQLLALGLLGAAIVVAIWIREAPSQRPGKVTGPSPLRDPRLRRLAGLSALLVVPQFTVVAFLVVYLVDEHEVRVATAALLLAVVQIGGGTGRIVAGRWADSMQLRLVPMRRLARLICLLFVAMAVLTDTAAAVPLVLLTGVAAISWNGLAFTAAGEFAGPGRAGAALGLQNTAVAIGAALTAPVVGLLVDATSWSVGFLLAAVCAAAASMLLGPLVLAERPHPAPPEESVAA